MENEVGSNSLSLQERVAQIEVKILEHEKKLNAQTEKNEFQIEMNTLLKMQIEANKEQNKQMEKFAATLDKVDDNLTNLNNNQRALQNEMVEIGERVEIIEQKSEQSKIDPITLFKGILSYLATGIGSIVIAVIIWKLTK